MKTITVELNHNQAWALAQLCKRISFNDCRSNAVDNEETYLMLESLEKIREALSNKGVNPR